MESIIEWFKNTIIHHVPELDFSSLGDHERRNLKLGPEKLLAVIHAQELAV